MGDYIFTIIRLMSITDVIDILIVTFIFYKLYTLVNYTRAIQLLKGLGVLGLLYLLSDFAGLSMVKFFLTWLLSIGPFAILILFQPEIRRALEFLGRNKLISKSFMSADHSAIMHGIDEMIIAVDNLSRKKIGALIVFEGKTGLQDIIETGTLIDARIRSSLIENIFVPNAPLHDGATILRQNRIIAAGCLLPLSNDRSVARELGTRHRAALGMSANSDALILVVSEETGVISIAQHNELDRFLNLDQVHSRLEKFLAEEEMSLTKILKGETKDA